MPTNRLRIGTRGSKLARTQTEMVVAMLCAAHPGLEVSVEVITTVGDLRRDVPFAHVGAKGMFVKEIEEALLDGRIDVGVHSLKDMPSELPVGLEIGCVPQREDACDALVSRGDVVLEQLPARAIVGTSSIRRQAQLLVVRPDLQMRESRGNVDTRLRKLDEGTYDAIVLACAGLNRLGLTDRISQRLSPLFCLPAVGQGALALEVRVDDDKTLRLVNGIHHPDTAACVQAERGFQFGLSGGCSVPAAALATIEADELTLRAIIAAPDGSHVMTETASGSRRDARQLGLRAAELLLSRGGRALLAAVVERADPYR